MKNFVAIAIYISLTSCTTLSYKSMPQPSSGETPGKDKSIDKSSNREPSVSQGQEISYQETIKFISAKFSSNTSDLVPPNTSHIEPSKTSNIESSNSSHKESPNTSHKESPNTSKRIPLNGLYTKVTIKSKLDSISCKDNVKCNKNGTFNYLSRNGFLRFFYSKRVAISANANIDVKAYSATIPLLTITEISSNEVGESWERTKIYSKGDEPLFLIPPNVTSGSLKLVFRGSEDKSLSSSKALDITIGAIGILAPQSQLLTSLNKKALGDKANALDTAISKLFKESLTETVQVELMLDSWHPNDSYDLVMRLPEDKTNWSSTDLHDIGRWELKFEAPRVSAFYPIFVCITDEAKVGCKDSYNNAKEEVFKQFKGKKDFFRVLDASLYQINDSEKITIGSIMSKLTSVNQLDDTKYLETTYNAVMNSEVNLACADIARKSSELGLSSVDASLAIYSIFMASSIVKVPSKYWSENLSDFSACELAVSELALSKTAPPKSAVSNLADKK